ncbi:MAG: S-layer family protein, partial [Cyanobacteria bacterium J06555_13]
LALSLQDVLLLRNGSLISTEAGTAGTGGDGGDIALSTGFVVAVPSENSDIRANAFEGDGGNVTVTARNLLGIAFRPGLLESPLSDITASSRFGRSGDVVVTELNPDTLQPERELPVDTAPPTVARGCRGQGAQTGSFVSSGRGGLPENPISPLSADGLWQDLAPLDLEALENQGDIVSQSSQELVTTEPIVEARAWQRDRNGIITLFAQAAVPAEHLAQAGTCLSSEHEK